MNAYRGIETTIGTRLMQIGTNSIRFANRLMPIIYIAILLLPLMLKQSKWREALCCFFGIGGFLLQFWFIQKGWHYHLYMIPFALLLIPIMLSMDLNKYLRLAVWGIVGFTAALGIYSAYYNRVYKVYAGEGKNDYEKQWKLGGQVSDIVQEGETIFIPHAGLAYVYYTANVYPSFMSEIGYGNGPMELTIESAAKCVSETNYVLHFSREMMSKLYGGQDFEYYYSDSIQQFVDQFPCDTLEADVVLHYMNRPKLSIE